MPARPLFRPLFIKNQSAQIKGWANNIKKNQSNLTAQKVSKQGRMIEHPDSFNNSNAYNINAKEPLTTKLNEIQDMQKNATRTRKLSNGKIRYYGIEKPAKTPGPTRGGYNVLEWDPKTLQTRGWYECKDHIGKVNRVHPKTIN